MRPWTIYALRRLYHDGPQPLRDLLIEASEFVPPGRAARAAAMHSKHGGNTAYGSRKLVRDSLRMVRIRGNIEWYLVDDVKWVRISEKGRKRYSNDARIAEAPSGPVDELEGNGS